MTEYANDDSESSDGVVCAWGGCEREFDNTYGMKVHHVSVHGESIAGVAVDCAWCGATKHVDPHEAEKYDNHFCGPDCHGEWKSANLTGEDSPSWSRGTKACAWCGTTKPVQQHRIKSNENHYCGPECQGNWLAENRSGEDSPNWEGGPVAVGCTWCGSEKQVPQTHAETRKRHFCGRRCMGDWLAANWSGEDHPNWKGGTFRYGTGWTEEKREAVRERQDRRCASCGVHEDETVRKLPVHHIRPARTFDDDDPGRHDKSNLVALCQPCHMEWEQITPLRPQTPYLD